MTNQRLLHFISIEILFFTFYLLKIWVFIREAQVKRCAIFNLHVENILFFETFSFFNRIL